jgi:hypothetical protein
MKQDPLWIEQETVEIRPERNTPPPPKWEPFFGPGAKNFGIIILGFAAIPFVAAWWVTRWVLLPAVCVAIVGGSAWYLLSTINFDAPFTLGGAIVIGMIVLAAASSSRRTFR